MIRVGIAGIGLTTAGIENWRSAQPVLQGKTGYILKETLINSAARDEPLSPSTSLRANGINQHFLKSEPPVRNPVLLSGNEQRRATPLIKLALNSAQQAMEQYKQWNNKIENIASVFASSCGDLSIDDQLLQALQLNDRPVSPTHFHNSVHNAAAGYYSIATGSHAASTSLSAFNASFAAGLLEAATQVIIEEQNVLLVAYDMPPPATLSTFCPQQFMFSCALLLTPNNVEFSCTKLEIALKTTAIYTKMDDPDFEILRAGNPAARSLPLLQQLANNTETTVTIPYLHKQCLEIAVLPC